MTCKGYDTYRNGLTASSLFHRIRSVHDGHLIFSLSLVTVHWNDDLVSYTLVPISYLYVGAKVIDGCISKSKYVK